MMPMKPKTSATTRPRFSRSPSMKMAMTLAQIGVVNSMAKTSASGSSAIPVIQPSWAAKWTMLRENWVPSRAVRHMPGSAITTKGSRITSEPSVRNSMIWKL